MKIANEIRPFFVDIYRKSDGIIEKLLFFYFLFGIGLSFFYDTYLVGVGVGSLCLLLYFLSKKLFPDTSLNQYIASLVAGIFMAQFIYQMHGLFEMHFTAFIAIIALITYQNKFAFIPQLLFVVIHHSSFAYIQYLGFTKDVDKYKQIYFTQLEYMDFQTFLFHAGLYALGVTLAAIYAHNLELNTVNNARNIIKLQSEEQRMKRNIQFANEIASGDFDKEYDLIEGDEMGKALVEMRGNLKSGAKREKEERFINVGIAEVADILRTQNNNLEELSYKIITYLVKYIGLNQGGMFVINDDNKDDIHLELKGAYAYERRKYLEKRVEIGEGLVGQCYLEKQIIYLKEIPEKYITITSGLGEAPPSNLVIVPIKSEENVEGILELASFRELEDYEKEFLTRVSENIAATIYSTKINNQTKLLFEQSQQQAEEMRAQEEEMRQNMEELSATQEEMERKTNEFMARFDAISTSNIGSIEFDLNGNIQEANETFCKEMGYELAEIRGKHHSIFVSPNYAESDEYREFWKKLKNGEPQSGEYSRIKKSGEQIVLYGAYNIIKDSNDNPVSVIKFAINITDYLNKSISDYQNLRKN